MAQPTKKPLQQSLKLRGKAQEILRDDRVELYVHVYFAVKGALVRLNVRDHTFLDACFARAIRVPHNLRINEIDGVRFDCSMGWILIRPSGTSPLMRVAVESRKGVDQAKKMLEDAKQLINDLLSA